jgi:hypothetical protein
MCYPHGPSRDDRLKDVGIFEENWSRRSDLNRGPADYEQEAREVDSALASHRAGVILLCLEGVTTTARVARGRALVRPVSRCDIEV